MTESLASLEASGPGSYAGGQRGSILLRGSDRKASNIYDTGNSGRSLMKKNSNMNGLNNNGRNAEEEV